MTVPLPLRTRKILLPGGKFPGDIETIGLDLGDTDAGQARHLPGMRGKDPGGGSIAQIGAPSGQQVQAVGIDQQRDLELMVKFGHDFSCTFILAQTRTEHRG